MFSEDRQLLWRYAWFWFRRELARIVRRRGGAGDGVSGAQPHARNSLSSCRLPTSARYISLREDTAPLRSKGTRGAAHFCPDSAHVDPAPAVHREAFRRAGGKGPADVRDRRIL